MIEHLGSFGSLMTGVSVSQQHRLRLQASCGRSDSARRLATAGQRPSVGNWSGR
jgi:hypothetical protein